jgi:short-subunit dehydrogenase
MPQRNRLITDVSSGFGRIMTEQLLARGDRVPGIVRELSVMSKLKAEHVRRQARARPDAQTSDVMSRIKAFAGLFSSGELAH